MATITCRSSPGLETPERFRIDFVAVHHGVERIIGERSTEKPEHEKNKNVTQHVHKTLQEADRSEKSVPAGGRDAFYNARSTESVYFGGSENTVSEPPSSV
jgi:hypothetical protein